MSNIGLINKLKSIYENLVFEGDKKVQIVFRFENENEYVLYENYKLDFENNFIEIKNSVTKLRRGIMVEKEYDYTSYVDLSKLIGFSIKML